MGKSITAAFSAIQQVLAEHEDEICKLKEADEAKTQEIASLKKTVEAQVQDNRKLNQIVEALARDVANLEQGQRHLRDQSIKTDVDRGVPSNKVAKAHGLSRSRVTQIAPRKH